jgi:hypothetical protein
VTVHRRQAKEEIHYKTREKDGSTNLEILEKAIKGQALSHGTEYVPTHIKREFRS